MIGKRAKILSSDQVEDLLVFARQTRHPIRNQVLVLLSVKAVAIRRKQARLERQNRPARTSLRGAQRRAAATGWNT